MNLQLRYDLYKAERSEEKMLKNNTAFAPGELNTAVTALMPLRFRFSTVAFLLLLDN